MTIGWAVMSERLGMEVSWLKAERCTAPAWRLVIRVVPADQLDAEISGWQLVVPDATVWIAETCEVQ
ncbi:MAG: hypothetical protein HYX76_06015 [Acidobacteria bacterium]|nr:hypothetical protein [Acidobacteriota bacterium]